jgi:IS5 family transposase
LARLLAEVDQLERWVHAHVPTDASPAVTTALTTLRRVLTQDLEPDPATGQPRIRQGVARDRLPSLGDAEMRHGRKTRTKPFTGYKRHVIKLIDADLIAGAVVRPANEPEHEALALLTPDVVRHGPLAEVFLDRGYLGSPRIGELHATGVAIRAKAWTSYNGGRFPKQAFVLEPSAGRVTCPAPHTIPIPPGATTVHFPNALCRPCALRTACTTAATGRSITIHPQEALLQTLRADQQRTDGRARLRTRTTIEHSLARVGQLQGSKARYKGTRKNTLDLRRTSAVANLQRIARLREAA